MATPSQVRRRTPALPKYSFTRSVVMNTTGHMTTQMERMTSRPKIDLLPGATKSLPPVTSPRSALVRKKPPRTRNRTSRREVETFGSSADTAR